MIKQKELIFGMINFGLLEEYYTTNRPAKHCPSHSSDHFVRT